MTSTVQNPVSEGRQYAVRFTNEVTSTGSVLVVVGWVPKHQHLVPPVQQEAVAPGAPPRELAGVVPDFKNARRMWVLATLDPGESGFLELLENGVVHTSEFITETTTWECLVSPKA